MDSIEMEFMESIHRNGVQIQQMESSINQTMLDTAKRHEEFMARIDQNQKKINQNFEEIFEMLRFLLKKKEERTILVKVKFEIYPISTEVLDKVFSTCGFLESVVKLSPGEEFHSEVCFQDQDSAIKALELYNDRCVYDRCCKLELFQASQVRDRSSPVGVPNPEIDAVSEDSDRSSPVGVPNPEIDVVSEDSTTQDSPRCPEWESEALLGSVHGGSRTELVNKNAAKLALIEEIDIAPTEDGADQSSVLEAPIKELKAEFNREEPQIQPNNFKVNHKPSIIYGGEINELAELVKLLIELMEIRIVNSRNHSMSGFRLNSIDGFHSAHQLFEEMTEEKILWFRSIPVQFGHFGDNVSHKNCVHLRCQKVSLGTQIFDPGGILGEADMVGQSLLLLNRNFDFRFIDDGQHSLPFDRGADAISVKKVDVNSVQTQGILLGIMIFDPGGRIEVLDCEGEFRVIGRDSTDHDGFNSSIDTLFSHQYIKQWLIFDPGGVALFSPKFNQWQPKLMALCIGGVGVVQTGNQRMTVTLVFDPGGLLNSVTIHVQLGFDLKFQLPGDSKPSR